MKCNHFLSFIALLSCCSCLPIRDNRLFPREDMQPPVLLSVAPAAEKTVRIQFNEPPVASAENFSVTPLLPVVETTVEEKAVTVELGKPQVPGSEYVLEGAVRDEHGNTTAFIVTFYGFNPHIPETVINEFTTQGSSTHPDVVELAVKSSGNMAGMCLYEGTYTDWDDKIIFPSLQVEPGDFILVHFKPQGIPEEIDETDDTAASGGLDASATAYDFWVGGGGGLSGNNGVLSLYSSPGVDLIDGVLYSNRTSASDETYRGFGSLRVLKRADELVAEGGWIISGNLAAPEDAVNPEDSTATRSICRTSSSDDSNSKHDWHIVPTSTFTFGSVNSDEVYSP